MNLHDVLSLKFPDAKFNDDIRLSDYGLGAGPEISYWDAEKLGCESPTPAVLAQWEKDVDLLYRQKQAVLKRRYPSVEDQLDMQYKDLRDGTSVWYTTIEAIKLAHPKPVE